MRRSFLTHCFALVLAAVSCRGQQVPDLSADEFEKKLASDKNVQLVDVRTPTEFEEGHLAGAVNMDWRSADFSQQVAGLEKGQPVLLYCLSGGRSAAAAAKLQAMGFAEVYNLRGGILKWTAASKPIFYPAGAVTPAGMTLNEYKKLVVGEKKFVLIDFTASWCRPCQQMKPMLNKLAAEKKDKLQLVMVDADEHKALLKAKGIEAIPYFELYESGKLVWKHQGAIDEITLLKETGL